MPHNIAPVLTAWWGTACYHAERHLADHEPIHIHRFRTHLRRLRAVLARLQPVLPTELDREARRRLQAMAKRTDALRDLDVLLACEAEWMALLSPDLAPGGLEVWWELRAERRRARQLTDAYLGGPQFAQQRAEITARLAALDEVDPDILGRRALRAIERQNRRLAKARRKLTADSRPQKWHRLRIRGKTLRYCLEACPPGVARTELLRTLRLLQQQLGEFNDLTVQQALLGRLAGADWSPSGRQAIAAWRCCLQAAQQEMQPRLPAALAAFCAPDTVRLLGEVGAPLR